MIAVDTPEYLNLCGNQPVSQVMPRPSERPKLGHDLREIHSTDWSERHLTQPSRDPELKHKLNFDFHTGHRRVREPQVHQ